MNSNGFTRYDCSRLANIYSGAYNDYIIGVVPYDIRATSGNTEYSTIQSQWTDYSNDSIINIRFIANNNNLSVANRSFKIVYLASNPAKNITVY